MREWVAVMPAEERELYEKAGFGGRQPFGKHPALLIVDVVLSFTGSKPRSTIDAIDEYKTSCGEAAWGALPNIRKILDAARASGIPVVYTKGDPVDKAFCGESTKRREAREESAERHRKGFPDIIAPLPNEYVLQKPKASAFFATPLVTYLNRLHVDSLLVTGCTTSGCVRATVTDAFSHGYTVFVIEECCFDRSRHSHLVNLFEMNAKYADVITLGEALDYLASLRE